MKVTTYKGNQAEVKSMNEKGELEFALVLDGRSQPIHPGALNARELKEIRDACNVEGMWQLREKATGYIAAPDIEQVREEIQDGTDPDDWERIDSDPNRFITEADKARTRIKDREGSTPEEKREYENYTRELVSLEEALKLKADGKYNGLPFSEMDAIARLLELRENPVPAPRPPDKDHVFAKSEGEIKVSVKPKKTKAELQAEARKAWEKEDARLVKAMKTPQEYGFRDDTEVMAALLTHRGQA